MTIHIGDRPPKLTDEVMALILGYVATDLMLNNAARCAGIHELTLKTWMKLGQTDLLEDRETFLSKFYLKVRKNQGIKISQLLVLIESGTKNWQGAAWKLEKCFAEEFGNEAPAYKDLLEKYHQLMSQCLGASKPTHGAITNGREMDSSSHS
jgi:hypothetical protein